MDEQGGSATTVGVRILTEYGPITVAMDGAHAPITAANFLRFVDDGAYDGGRFHRTVTLTNQPDDTVRIAVTQAGVRADRQGAAATPIPLERTTVTGLTHREGTVSKGKGAGG